MTITEVKQALGSWQIRLREYTPRAILDQLGYFGHIAVLPNKVNPAEYGDNLLSAARYVGVFRRRDAQDEFLLNGSGMAYWLGDEDGKGDVFESPVVLTGATFAASVAALLPPSGAVIAGTINSVAGTYTGTHRWQTPRQALDYVTPLFGAEWRVNNNGTLDAGTVSQLYITTPKAILLRRADGRDLSLKAYPGRMGLSEDAEDHTTRVVVLAEGEGGSIATGSADGPATPFNHLFGGDIKITRLVSESDTTSTNANARAQLALNQFLGKKQQATLSTDSFDIKGDIAVGDYLDVYDPDNGFYDPTRERYWDGVPINPVALRCVEMTWPVPEGWTVAFRTVNGLWLDLSPYYAAESGETTVVVGALNRSVTSSAEPIGIRPNLPEGGGADSTIPGVPVFTGFSPGAYQSNETSTTKAAIRAQWDTPLNVDASTITDGDHYEIRYRVNAFIGYAVPWDLLAGYSGMLRDGFERVPEVAGWGKPDFGSPDWAVTSAPTPANFFTNGSQAKITVNSVNVERAIVGGLTATDSESYHRFSYDAVPVGAEINTYVYSRYINSSNHYRLRIAITVGLGIFLRVEKVFGGVLSLVGAGFVQAPGAFVANKMYNVMFRTEGTSLLAKIWADGELIPIDWQLNETDGDVTGAGQTGIRVILTTGNTNGTVTYTYDKFIAANIASSAPFTWDDLGTWDGVLSEPVEANQEWMTAFVGWGTNAYTIMELTPGVTYELQIRAVDSANPPHFGNWSASSFVTTTGDVFPPSTPAAPLVAGSTIAIQIIHSLGKASGGTFNLEQDLDHFDVHVGGSGTFACTPDNKLGELIANASMINAGVAAVGTFQVPQVDMIFVKVVAVDRAGNRSTASEAAAVTAELIDDQYINSLTASKITAGTLSAAIVNAGKITTALEGRRVEVEGVGLSLYGAGSGRMIQLRADDRRLSFWEPVDEGEGSMYSNPVIELGRVSTGQLGMRIGDLFGDTKAIVGQIDPAGGFDSDNYGIALENSDGDVVKLSDYIFGPQKAEITSVGSRTSETFGDLTDFIGPYVTNVKIGPLGRCFVTLTAYMEAPDGGLGLMGVQVINLATLATVRAPDDFDALSIGGGTNGSPPSKVFGRASCVVFIDGLDAGVYEFVAKYRRIAPDPAESCLYANRQMIVQPY